MGCLRLLLNKKIRKNSLRFTIGFICYFVHVTPINAQQVAIDNGINYLKTTQSIDGTWGGTSPSLNTILQTTSTAARTFQILNITDPTLTNAINFLLAQAPNTTDDLAQQIEVLTASGADLSTQITTLKAVQQADGGWGLALDLSFTSETIDTASALRAINIANAADNTTVSNVLEYLLESQNPDGGWGVAKGENSHVYYTAQALIALNPFASTHNLDTSIDNAVNYLLSQQTASGNWNNSVFLSALAYIGLHDFIPITPTTPDLVSFLTGQQAANGSWLDDPYSTALAIRALHLTTVLPANPTRGIIKGAVLDVQTNLPLSGVTIDLSGPTAQSFTTLSDGLFEFKDLEPGSYGLSFSLPDYVGFATTTQINADQTIDLGTLQMNKITVPETATIKGTITDQATGLFLEGVAITVTGIAGTVFTNAEGTYQINNVPTGTATITAMLEGYQNAATFEQMDPGEIFIFSPTLLGGDTSVFPWVEGIITDGATGLPLEGVLIQVNDFLNRSDLTDVNGSYKTFSFFPGIYTVTASLVSYDTVTVEINAQANNQNLFSPTLYPEGTTPPGANTSEISGLVLDAGTNTPLSNVTVTATSGSNVQTLQSGADGRFLVSGFTRSSASLQFDIDGYAASETSVILKPLAHLDIGQVRLRQETVLQILPDLTLSVLDKTGLITDSLSLAISGTLNAEVGNIGSTAASGNISLIAFHDADLNNRYDANIDLFLGQTNLADALLVDARANITVPVAGTLPFLDAPIHLWIDDTQTIVELDENNNTASTSDLCISEPDRGTFAPVLKWKWEETLVLPDYRQVMSMPVVAPLVDTNGDNLIDENDIPAVIFHTFKDGNWGGDGVLRAVSGQDGSELWTVSNPLYRTNASGNIAVGDIDGDGLIEILVPRNGTGLFAFEHDGTLKWQSLAPGVLSWAGPSLADLDADGTPEIIIGNQVLNADGSLRWQGLAANKFILSTVADLDLDGSPEVISAANNLTAYRNDGTIFWQSVPTPFGKVGIGNFNDDPYPEIAVVFVDLYLLDHQGSILWGPVMLPGGGAGGVPTIADFDGDGLPEIGIAGGSRYVVFDTDGSVLWTTPTQDFSSGGTGSSAFDFDGDGQVEIVYADERYLRVYNGADGTVLFQIENTSGTAYELPVVADVDQDNHSDIVVATNDYFISGFGSGIRVYEDQNNSWVNTRSIWNQHSYHIDNINDDGTVPTVEEKSWQTHNTYRLNATPKATAVPDLTASVLEVIDNGTGQPFSLSVRIGNGGALASPDGVLLSFYQGDPNTSGILLGSQTLGIIPAGDYQDIVLAGIVSLSTTENVFAVVDPANQVIECSESNNSVNAAIVPQSFLAQIDVATDSPSYLANEAVVLTAQITNLSALSGMFFAVLQIEDANGMLVESFGSEALGVLTGGSTVSITKNWNTATNFSGDYHLKGILRDNNNVMLSVVTSPFTILPGSGASASLNADKIVYASNEFVTLTSTLISQSPNSVLSNLGASVTVNDPSGIPLYSETKTLSDLLPETRVTFDTFFDTATHSAGLYSATVQLHSNGNLLTTTSTTFEITSSLDSGLSLSGTLDVLPKPIEQNQNTTMAFTIQNVGNVAILPLVEISILVVDPDTGTVIDTLTDITVLNGQLVYGNNVPFDSSSLAPKSYLVVLQGTVNGMTQSLDSTGLEILAPTNVAPVADANFVFVQNDCLSTACDVTLDGSASTDPDSSPETEDDIVSYQWYENYGTAEQTELLPVSGPQDVSVPLSTVSLSLGNHEITLVVTDTLGLTATDTILITLDAAALSLLQLEEVEVEWDENELEIEGKVALPLGKSPSDLTATATVTVTLSTLMNNPVVDQSVVFTVEGSTDQEWEFEDENVSVGITEFEIDWEGAKFDYNRNIRIQSDHIGSTSTSLEIERKEITGAFSIEVNGVTIDISSDNTVTSTLPDMELDVDDDEIELELPFALTPEMVINISGWNVANTITVGDYFTNGIGKFELEALFHFDATIDINTLNPTLDLDLSLGAEDFTGSFSLGPLDWEELDPEEWEYEND